MGLILILALFANDNAEFFEQSKKQLDDGYHWEYVGKRKASEYSFSLPVIDQQSGEKLVYWELQK